MLGKGIQLFPNSVVQTGAKVGDYSILNTGSILEHHCEVGNGVHIMPGATIGIDQNIFDLSIEDFEKELWQIQHRGYAQGCVSLVERNGIPVDVKLIKKFKGEVKYGYYYI